MNRAAAGSTRRPFAGWDSAERPAVIAALAIALAAIALRVSLAPQFDGLDDLGYLEAAQRVSQGRTLDGMFPLFRTRVGMAYPLGWLLQAGWLVPAQFWILTVAAECVTLASLFAAGWLLAGTASAGLAAAALYAVYPLAVQQAVMFYPTAFQVAAIAAACAFIAGAERVGTARGRIGLGLAAGLSLGLGYLVKEDVAIVVPAVAMASLLAGFPRRSTAMAVMAGAAAVFGVECVAYWASTGNPLFRLTATSGLAAAPQDQLQISEIWRWDAFLRSLWLMPVQVGIHWWLGIPAVWSAYRRRSLALAFVATAFLLLLLYLQFGSGSLSSYAPLPKTPRYTALVTPLLMLLAGSWLADQFLRSRRSVAVATSLVAALAAVPCIAYLDISSSERTRNTLAVLPALRAAAPEQLFTDYYGARVLRILEPELAKVSVWYHARFDTNEIIVLGSPASTADAYVLLDRQAAKIYTSSYEMTLPPEIAVPPADWQLVWSGRAYEDGSVTRTWLEAVRAAANRLPNGNPLSSRIERSIADLIDADQAYLYRVPASITGLETSTR
jgi:hypothetical protein